MGGNNKFLSTRELSSVFGAFPWLVQTALENLFGKGEK